MADSTWFHGSQWPPGNHGIMPDGNCNDARCSAVARTSSADTTPGRSGTALTPNPAVPPNPATSRRGRLGAVDDEALAEDR